MAANKVEKNNNIPSSSSVCAAPHEWNITRAMWLAKKYETTETTSAYEPLRLVVIQHTVSQECRVFVNCAAEMRNLQAWSIRDCPCDIA